MTHGIDSAETDVTLRFPPEWVDGLRAHWQLLMSAAVWGDLETEQLGAASRLRRRLLELGERTRSLVAPRDWIPHRRERVKSALAAALAVRETLSVTEAALTVLKPGLCSEKLNTVFGELRGMLTDELQQREMLWARLLDSQIED